MDTTIHITLKSKILDTVYEIKVRPKISVGFTFTFSKDLITWISNKDYAQSIAYISDFLILLPITSNFIHNYILLEIPGFPIMEIDVRDLDEKIISAIICRISDYMSNHWSVFKK
jgi:hypothetical protein